MPGANRRARAKATARRKSNGNPNATTRERDDDEGGQEGEKERGAMPKPLAICLEDLGATREATRFLQCTAVVGREPGLRLGTDGGVFWRAEEGTAELWVSLDDRLILYRTDPAGRLAVHRSGRSLEAPVGMLVVLLDGDELAVGERRLRVHVHGETSAMRAPEFYRTPSSKGAMRAAAAAVALGAALGGAACAKGAGGQADAGGRTEGKPPEVEIRTAPPAVAIPEPDRTKPADWQSGDVPPPETVPASDAGVLESPTGLGADAGQDIEVRVAPPAVPVQFPPDEVVTPRIVESADAEADAGSGGADGGAPEDADAARDAGRVRDAPIEVRIAPPSVRRPDPDRSR
jgi:hypothetical protein